jgi:PPOX class probable F420-dependent enzyme
MSMIHPTLEKYQDLFVKRAFAHVATIMADGTPQVTPMWCDFDGEYVRLNSARGLLKDRNMSARPYIALSILDPDNPYRYVQVRGPIVEITTEGADAHIDALSKKYTGAVVYGNRRPDEVRVTYKIVPEHVNGIG